MKMNTVVDTVAAIADSFEYWGKQQSALGYESIWSIYDAGNVDLDFEIFNNKMRQVRYEYIRPDATTEELMTDLRDGGKRSSAEVTMFATDGSVKSLWFAAESCIRQSGTHHRYIEDFEMQEDGSLMLITGS
jgi:hypothetical protein